MARARRKLALVMGAHWSAVKGGAQYQAYCLAEELSRDSRFEVYYLARHVDESFKSHGYRIIRVGAPRVLWRYGFSVDAPSILGALSSIRPDVVYQRGLQSNTGTCAYYARKHGARFVFHIGSDYDVIPRNEQSVPFLAGLGAVEKRIGEYGLRKADVVIAQTQRQVELLTRNYGRHESCVVRNFHPFPSEEICKSQDRLTVVWIANFKPVKRPEVFVRLAHDLGHLRQVEFVMIGRTGPVSTYGQLLKEIELTRNLTCLGERSLDEINQILAKAHVLVNTSSIEGVSNTFIQAWMRKVPVVTQDVDVDGVLQEQIAGIRGGSYDGMRSSLIRVLEDSGLRRRLGDQAQQYAFEHYSFRNVQDLKALLV